MRIYVIKDTVAEECGPLFEAKNDAVAIRSFENLRKNQPNPDDFSLWEVGYRETITSQDPNVSGIVLHPTERIVQMAQARLELE